MGRHGRRPLQLKRVDTPPRFGFHAVSGAHIRLSCGSGVFVDEPAESVASVELAWWVRTYEA